MASSVHTALHPCIRALCHDPRHRHISQQQLSTGFRECIQQLRVRRNRVLQPNPCHVILPRRSTSIGSPHGSLQDHLHRLRHTTGALQPFLVACGRFSESLIAVDAMQRLRNAAAVRGGHSGLHPLQRHRPVNLQAHSQLQRLIRVNDLVPKARAHNNRRAIRQRLGETVLPTVRQENAHSLSKHTLLRQAWCTHYVCRQLQVRTQGVFLDTQRDHQKYTVVTAKGVKGSAPGSPAKLATRKATCHT
mmetsp:Transcript_27062/g.56185  ORF Transcript_27062/g.56185 Transcript_27062/m.56185 type:complete len:247 (+) Transcript_27062:75-815(+)